jgi:hypothetical protein
MVLPPSIREVQSWHIFNHFCYYSSLPLFFRCTLEKDEKTEILLSHFGWPKCEEWDQACPYFDDAWSRVLAELEKSCVK